MTLSGLGTPKWPRHLRSPMWGADCRDWRPCLLIGTAGTPCRGEMYRTMRRAEWMAGDEGVSG